MRRGDRGTIDRNHGDERGMGERVERIERDVKSGLSVGITSSCLRERERSKNWMEEENRTKNGRVVYKIDRTSGVDVIVP